MWSEGAMVFGGTIGNNYVGSLSTAKIALNGVDGSAQFSGGNGLTTNHSLGIRGSGTGLLDLRRDDIIKQLASITVVLPQLIVFSSSTAMAPLFSLQIKLKLIKTPQDLVGTYPLTLQETQTLLYRTILWCR